MYAIYIKKWDLKYKNTVKNIRNILNEKDKMVKQEINMCHDSETLQPYEKILVKSLTRPFLLTRQYIKIIIHKCLKNYFYSNNTMPCRKDVLSTIIKFYFILLKQQLTIGRNSLVMF